MHMWVPSETLGKRVQVDLHEGCWAIGVVMVSDMASAKIQFADAPELDGWYPTKDLTVTSS